MQYLLTEDEYKQLQAAAKAGIIAPTKQQLQAFCTMVADSLPVKVTYREDKIIWGCIITGNGHGYCDDCPARKICPYDSKSWSQ